MRLESLEERVLFSAELAAGWLPAEISHTEDNSSETELQILQQSLDGPEPGTVRELVIVDGAYNELRSLYQELKALHRQDHEIDYLLIDTGDSISYALQAIGDSLSNYQNLQTIHLLTHAEQGHLVLGGNILDANNLEANSLLIKPWQDSLAAGADMMLYGCNLLAAADGEIFVEQLAQLTDTDIAASTNLTGTADLGGDWQLEHKTGKVESKSLFDKLPPLQWRGSLDFTSDLIHHWKLDSIPVDAVGNADFSLVNGADYTAGFSRDGLRLDGDADAPFRRATADAGYSGMGTSDFTIALWVNASSFDQDGLLIGDVFAAQGFELVAETSGIVSFFAMDSSSSVSLQTSAALVVDEWSMISVTRQGSEWTIGLNDELGASRLVTTAQTMNDSISGSSLNIGSYATSAMEFDGVLDDIRIYNRALSTEDLRALATEPPETPNTAPVAHSTTQSHVQLEDNFDDIGINVQAISLLATDSDEAASIIAIAIDSDASTLAQGHWQYSTDSGSNWFDLDIVNANAALVLQADTNSSYLRFMPSLDYNGTTPELQVHVIDESYSGTFSNGDARIYLDTTHGGGSSSISANSTPLSVTINAINDAPDLSQLPDAFFESIGVSIAEMDGLAYGDFDGDGDQDLVITSSVNSEIWVSSNRGDGISEQLTLVASADFPVSPHVVDLDGDGHLDIIVPSDQILASEPDVIILQGDGSGAFSVSEITYSGEAAFDLVTSDVDDNGLLDIVVVYTVTDEVVIHPQTAPRVFGPAIVLGTPLEPYFIAVGDINGDGDEDFVVSSNLDEQIVLYESGLVEGAGFTTHQLLNAPDPDLVELADLDGDSDLDIVWTSYGNGQLLWMENDGALVPTFTTRIIDESGGELWDLALVDHNNDGAIDIITTNPLNDTIMLYQNDSNGVFSSLPLSRNTDGAFNIEVMDIDGNTQDDLVITNSGSESVELIRSNATQSMIRTLIIEDSITTLPAVIIDDIDVGSDLLDVQLTVTDGSLAFAVDAGITYSVGSSLHSSAKTFSGSLADINNALASMEFRPANNFTGNPVIEIQVEDRGNNGAGANGAIIERYGIAIIPSNDVPDAAPDSFSVDEGGIFSGDLSANDTDIDGDALTASVSVSPLYGTLQLQNNGSFTYTHDGSATTTDSFSYIQEDPQGAQDSAVVSVSITALNDAPIANDDVFSISSGEDLSDSVATNDSDEESAQLTFALQTQASHGTVVLSENGDFVYSNGAGPASADSFTYSATDAAGATDTASVSISILTVNAAPQVSLDNKINTLAENYDTSNPVRIADIQISDDGLGSNQLSLQGPNAGLFQISGNQLELRSGISLDYELLPTLSVSVVVQDSTLPPADPPNAAVHELLLLDINEAPEISVIAQLQSISESAAADASTQVAEIVISDDALGSETLLLSGDDSHLFELTGNSITFVNGAILDFETNPVLDLTVQVDDDTLGNGPEDSAAINLPLIDANEPPTLQLVNTIDSLAESTDTAEAIKIADIELIDDALGSNSTVLSPALAEDFELIDDALYLKAETDLDYEELNEYLIGISVFDSQTENPEYFTVEHRLMITDSNEPPSLQLSNTLSNLSESADVSEPIKVADIIIADDALGNNQLLLSGVDSDYFRVVDNGLFLAADVELGDRSLSALNVIVSVSDLSLDQQFAAHTEFSLQLIASPGQLMLHAIETQPLEFTEGDITLALTSTLIASSSNSSNIAFATVRFVEGYQNTEDVLEIDETIVNGLTTQNGGIFTHSFDRDSGVFTLLGSGTAAQYMEAIQAVGYRNTAENPSSDTREVAITVFSESMESNTVMREIAVIATNDIPEVVNQSVVTLQAGESITIDTSVLLSVDPDQGATDIRYTVTTLTPGLDILVAGEPSLSFTQADVNAGQVSFVHDSTHREDGVLQLQVDDGAGGHIDLTINVEITPLLGAAVADSTVLPELFQQLPGVQEVDATDSVIEITESVLSGTPESDLQIDQVDDTEQENEGNHEALKSEDSDSSSTETLQQPQQVLSSTPEPGTQFLVALNLPDVPFNVTVFQTAPIDTELAEFSMDISTSGLVEDMENQKILATLLGISPINTVVDAKKWYQWQSDNGGFQSSLEELEQSFDKATKKIEDQGLVSDLVLGSSLSLTTGFLVWLLRGGTLMASLMSIAPLWTQLDPLPIVARKQKTADTGDDNVESLFQQKQQQHT